MFNFHSEKQIEACGFHIARQGVKWRHHSRSDVMVNSFTMWLPSLRGEVSGKCLGKTFAAIMVLTHSCYKYQSGCSLIKTRRGAGVDDDASADQWPTGAQRRIGLDMIDSLCRCLDPVNQWLTLRKDCKSICEIVRDTGKNTYFIIPETHFKLSN